MREKMTMRIMVLLLLIVTLQFGCKTQYGKGNEMSNIRVRYMIDQLDPAVDFYTKQLGFQVKQENKPYFAMLSRGNLELILSANYGPGGAAKPMSNGQKAQPGGWNRIIINVNDLPREVSRLKDTGVHFRNEISSGPGGSEILLDDPSGNPVELFQPAG